MCLCLYCLIPCFHLFCLATFLHSVFSLQNRFISSAVVVVQGPPGLPGLKGDPGSKGEKVSVALCRFYL